MESFVASRVIDAPAHAAWAVVADYTRDPQWRAGVHEMRLEPPGEVAEGSTTHEVMSLAGRTYRNDAVVTRVVPGARIEWRTTAGADAHGSRMVQPRGTGRCEVVLELHVVPHGLSRILSPLLRRLLAKNLRGDLERLAGIVLEQVPAPS